jgi:acyl-CoA synthetase (NDP forming)
MYRVDETTRAIDNIFNARSIAVVGASNDLTKFGGMTIDTIIRGGYKGRIYPVNPKSDRIQGLKAYPALDRIPEQLDAVIVIVPAIIVPQIISQAAAKGAKGVVIMSAGFKEVGNVGLEKEILTIARKHGLRLMGPNIQGFNYLPNNLCAMFMPVIKTRGPIVVISQSGSITTVLSEWAENEGLGISAAVNVGNQADLCAADYINYFAQDPYAKAIAMYLESVKNGKAFLQSLENALCKKPVCIFKAGSTEAGQQTTVSHTGALAGNYKVFSGACRQYGAVIAPDLETLYDQAKALSTFSDLRGSRIAVISSSGGANNIAVDAAQDLGLRINGFPSELINTLEKLELSPLAHLDNPVDLGSINGEDYKKVAMAIDQYNVADIILMNFADPVYETSEVVISLATDIGVPVAVSLMGGGIEEKNNLIAIQRSGIPVFPSPERAMRGIGAVTWSINYRKNRGLD